MILKHLKRLLYAFKGIYYALKNDSSYRLQFYGVAAVTAIFMYLFEPLSNSEIQFLILAYVLILITELQNTAFETALDKLHPEIHDQIGRSKDMAAGAVLIAGLFLLFVMSTIILL